MNNMASSKSTTFVLGQSCMRKTRKTIHDAKIGKSVHFDGYPSLSHSLTSSVSSINNNHSKARLDLLSARVSFVSGIPVQDKDKIKNMGANATLPDESVQPNYIQYNSASLKRNATLSFCDLMIKKYSNTSFDEPLETYDIKNCKSIMRKYSGANGEEIMKKYGAKSNDGDLLRKYSVVDYDKTMRSYSPVKCKEIIDKYSDDTIPIDRVQSPLEQDGKEDSGKIVRKSGKGGTKKMEDKTPKRKVSKVESRFSKDNNSTTKFSAVVRKPSGNNKITEQRSRKDSSRNVSGKTNNVQKRKNNALTEKDHKSRHVNRKRKANAGYEFQRDSPKRKGNSRQNVDSKMKARNVTEPYAVRPHQPVQISNSSSRMGSRDPIVKNYYRSLRRGEDIISSIPSTTTFMTYGENDHEENDYFDDVLDESALRLQHLLNRQAKVSTYSPSTPVDRKDLGKTTPRSIYEKMESEHRREKYKNSPLLTPRPQDNASASHKYHPRKFGSKHVQDRIKFNRTDSTVPSQGGSYVSLDPRVGLDSGISVDECPDCSEGMYRQVIPIENYETIQYHQMLMAESQQRAYGVYMETGQRATKPGDLMEVVKYLNNDTGMSRSEDEGNRDDVMDKMDTGVVDNWYRLEETAASDPQDDFISEYRKLQGRVDPVKMRTHPSTELMMGHGKMNRHQHFGNAMDHMRRQGVHTWLQRRGIFPRCQFLK